MIKIGIYTLNGNDNYGNKLQNLALKEFIEGYECKVETIWIESKIDRLKNFIKYFLYILFRYNRRISFLKFNKYLNINYINSEEKMNKYDFVVVGSDQVWNTSFKSFSESYLLKKVDNSKRVSYAASIGIKYIENDYLELFNQELSKFKYISVREEEAKLILEKNFSLKNINVHLDPTMLLSKNEWDKYVKRPTFHKIKKYILLYFLGDIDSNCKKNIFEFAIKNNCEVINILDSNDKYYSCGPSEFLYLEKNAFMIFTDSFHSSVFSIIFERPFVVFERKQKGMGTMNSRIKTLLSTFNLENRVYNVGDDFNNMLKINYKNTKKILNRKIRESRIYFDNILGVVSNEK